MLSWKSVVMLIPRPDRMSWQEASNRSLGQTSALGSELQGLPWLLNAEDTWQNNLLHPESLFYLQHVQQEYSGLGYEVSRPLSCTKMFDVGQLKKARTKSPFVSSECTRLQVSTKKKCFWSKMHPFNFNTMQACVVVNFHLRKGIPSCIWEKAECLFKDQNCGQEHRI